MSSLQARQRCHLALLAALVALAEWAEWAECLQELACIKETPLPNKIQVGPPKLTRFEKARVVGARALQIAMGAPILVEPSALSSPIDIAMSELDSGVLPMTIRRTLPDGTYQDIPLKWLFQEN